MRGLVIGDPRSGALDACAAVAAEGTLIWHEPDALRDAADALETIGWDALLIDSGNEAFSTASMAFRAQLHGPVPGAVVHVPAEGAPAMLAPAVMAVRHLPVLPVLVTGAGAADFLPLWEEPCSDLELEPPTVVATADLGAAWAQCIARAEAAPPPQQAAHHH